MRSPLVLLWVLLMAVPAWGDMPSEARVKAVAEAWLAKRPAPGFGAAMTMAEAAKVQEQYNRLTAADLGEPVGYKAGLTNPAVVPSGPICMSTAPMATRSCTTV